MTEAWMTEREHAVDVRIGVTQSPREIEVDLGDAADVEALSAQMAEALDSKSGMLWLTDRKGRKVGVVASKVAYIEIDSGSEDRRVGFSSATTK
jgi:hypothetical protein